MRREKINLQDLNVKSFITGGQELRGGYDISTYLHCENGTYRSACNLCTGPPNDTIHAKSKCACD